MAMSNETVETGDVVILSGTSRDGSEVTAKASSVGYDGEWLEFTAPKSVFTAYRR